MSPRRSLAGLVLAAGLGLPPAAADTPAVPAPAPAPELDAAASEASIEVDLRVGGRVKGRFGRIEGRIERLPDDRLRVIVRLDAQGLALDGPGWMARSMRSPRFLDVDAHPWIHFRSEPFDPILVRNGGGMVGDLVLREVTRAVRFQVEPEACAEPGHGCAIRVHGVVSRQAFGMDAYRMWLKDEVGFDFRVRLRQPEQP